MPNWCNNRLILKHKSKAQLNKAEKAFRKGKLLNAFIPIPKKLLNTAKEYTTDEKEQKAINKVLEANTKKYGYPTWYEFCTEQWGTKWDVGGEEGYVEKIDGGLEFRFDSAWAPPIAAYQKLIELGFEVYATYHEPGMGYIGEFVDGVEHDYDTDSRSIPKHLYEEYMSDSDDEDDDSDEAIMMSFFEEK